jgi:5'-deoxynucleotidase YfbR-like HD superfamily hydrolase
MDARQVEPQTFNDLIELSRLLGEFGQIKRTTKLPDGDYESDSHHSFALALTAYELAQRFAPELSGEKILLYGLTHDLPELVTGDLDTLNFTPEQLAAKAEQDKLALEQTNEYFRKFPRIMNAVEAYETKADDEALFVYWVDKMMTIPTHFFDYGANLRAHGITSQQDIEAWYTRTLEKLGKQKPAHTSAVKVLEFAYYKMHDELFAA